MGNCGNGWEFLGKSGRKNFCQMGHFPRINTGHILLTNLTIIMIKYETFCFSVRISRLELKNSIK